jgi:hypothetical protein
VTAIETQLIKRLKVLPPGRVAEVADFTEFLILRENRTAAAQHLTENLRRLDALDLPTISEEEIEAEIKAARQERRSRQEH